MNQLKQKTSLERIIPDGTAIMERFTSSDCCLQKTGHCPIDNLSAGDIPSLVQGFASKRSDEDYCLRLAAIMLGARQVNNNIDFTPRLKPLRMSIFEGALRITDGRHRYCIASRLNAQEWNVSLECDVSYR